MITKERFLSFVKTVWGNHYFLILFIFNLLSSVTALTVYVDLLSVFLVFCLSSLVATIESCICRLFRNNTARKCFLYFFVALNLLIAIVDVFLIINFQMMFSAGIVGILAETNLAESQSFLKTYLNFPTLLAFITGTCVIIWFAFWLSQKMVNNRTIAILSMLLSLCGVFAYLQMVYNHIVSGEGGNSISQLHSSTRVGYSFIYFKQMQGGLSLKCDINRDVVATINQEYPPMVVVIIGESFSLYHSSLYGYNKTTNPLLDERVKDGSLVVFDDVVSNSDHTGIALSAIYSANGPNEPNGKDVFFPSCFKKAGYETVLLDNQYFIGNGYTWITDNVLSDIMFDYRNKHSVDYDADLISDIPQSSDLQLIVVHLIGQHYTYADRYPSNFKHFKASDYSDILTPDEREIVAHYDNATLYNDYVINQIIKKYEKQNSIVIYFSDHGEEIFEIDDFMGHGNAAQRPTLKYQLRVPLLVWTSSLYRAKYPDVAQRIRGAAHKPIITDNISHFLFEVAGIETKYYCPEWSFINDNYQESRHRVVLGSIDYDNAKEEALTPRY